MINPNEKDQKLAIGILLLQYRNHLSNHPVYIVTEEIVHQNYVNDPVFNKIVDQFLLVLNKDTIFDPKEPMTEHQNIDYLFQSTISCAHNEKSRVVIVRERESNISADFYPSKNKWKDNKENQRIYYGDARDFIKWVQDRQK